LDAVLGLIVDGPGTIRVAFLESTRSLNEGGRHRIQVARPACKLNPLLANAITDLGCRW